MQVSKLIAALLLLAGLTACGGDEPATGADTDTETAAAEPVVSEAPQVATLEAPEEEVHLPPSDYPSPGMDMVMNGSSSEAFEESLEDVKSNLTKKEYAQLRSAIQYLAVYDLNNRGSKDRLYGSLDGMTPAEILEHARSAMNRR